jgi:voltage-gated potassium channel
MSRLTAWVRSLFINTDFDRRLLSVIIILSVLLGVGSIGYSIIEKWSFRDSLFMTVITLSTVGYNEIYPLTPRGEVFTIFLIILGVGGAAYTFSTITDYIVAGELHGLLRRRRMRGKIERTENHYIVCGYGRVGQQVVDGLIENGREVVVIDRNPEPLRLLDTRDIAYLVGDASDDQVLQAAGIQRAQGLSSCLAEDATNVFVVLSARALNPDLTIIARSNVTDSAPKLRIAGADQIVNPYLITGRRMAAELINPTIVEFLDVVLQHGGLDLRIEEIVVGATGELAERSLGQCNVRGETGVNILAVRRKNEDIHTDLGPDFTLNAGDILISLGTPEQLSFLAQRAGDPYKNPASVSKS